MTLSRTIAVGAMIAALSGAGGARAGVSHIDDAPPIHHEPVRASFGDVAQPITWLMMILGAGMIGASLRRRGETAVA
jgi:hypothetical protein